MNKDWVIYTNRARCRDCYRCVRTCPVKAVRVHDGQAQIVPELCIACGNCVVACPQGAKSIRDDLTPTKEAILAGKTVVASVAPSAPAFMGLRIFSQLEDALKGLGFAAAAETAFGAEMIGLAHRELVDAEPERHPIITSSCPVVVNLVEKCYPDLLHHLAPLISPMIAHGRWLRERYGDDAFIVFIGPCIAKKQEAVEPAVAGAIDAALTFVELRDWLQDAGLDIADVSIKDEPVDVSNARLFPVEGGLVGTANMDTSMLTSHIVTTSGLEACEDVLRGIRAGKLSACMVELMACEGGCINGPAMQGEQLSTYLARQRVIEYASRRQPQPMPVRDEWPLLSREFTDRHQEPPEFTEEQIQEMLHRVDKYSPEDELNCGACGYPTCREKAIATLRGMAEATMCIPYMRRRADSLRQIVMDVTPSGVIITDEELLIQEMSQSAERMFGCRLAGVAGRPLASVISSTSAFERVRDTGQSVSGTVVDLGDNLIVEQTIVPVSGQSLIVGILRDITESERQNAEMEHIRRESLVRTQDVINKQMRVAQEIAQLLGETTADTKMMLLQLARLMEEGRPQ